MCKYDFTPRTLITTEIDLTLIMEGVQHIRINVARKNRNWKEVKIFIEYKINLKIPLKYGLYEQIIVCETYLHFFSFN